MRLALKDIIHHGIEAVAFIAVGTLAVSSCSSACIAYGMGKISYLGTRKLLDIFVPQMSKDVKRKISWGVSLFVGAGALYETVNKVAGLSISVLGAAVTTLVVSGISMGIRTLADKGFKLLRKKEMRFS